MIEVLSTTATTALVELATVKARLGITGSGEDTLLAGYIADVSSAFNSFLGRPLYRQQYKETTWGTGAQRLILSRMPVERGTITATIDGVAETDFIAEDTEAGILFLEGGWPETDGDPDTVVTYWAGYHVPGVVAAWAATAARSAGAWARATAGAPFLFEVTTGGTTGSTEPTWPTTVGGTVTDGTVIWTARAAQELPAWVSTVASIEAVTRYLGRNRDATVTREAVDGFSVTYSLQDVSANTSGLSAQAETALARLRYRRAA